MRARLPRTAGILPAIVFRFARVASAALYLCAGLLLITGVQAADLTGMTADELWAHAEELRTAGKPTEAQVVYTYIVDHHADNEARASWALFRLCSASYGNRDINAALAYVEWLAADYPECGIMKSGYAASYLTAIHLVFRRDYAAGIAVAEDHLGRFGAQMKELERAKVVERLAQCHLKLNQPAQALAALKLHGFRHPDLLRLPVWHRSVYDAHVAQGDAASALSAARAAYALCDFTTQAVQDAAELVRDAFAAADRDPDGVAFVACQMNATAPNPLVQIPMPMLTADEMQQLLAAALRNPGHATVAYLYAADHSQALSAALLEASEASGDALTAALLEIARVLKATDLNVVRANQLAAFANGEAVGNPLADQPIDLAELPDGGPYAGLQAVQIAGPTLMMHVTHMAQQEHASPARIREWLRSSGASTEEIVAALDSVKQSLPMPPAFIPLSAEVWERHGSGAEQCAQLPYNAKLLLGIYLGTIDEEEQAKTLLSALENPDRAALGADLYRVSCELLDYQESGYRLAMWAHKRGAELRGPADVAFVSWMLKQECAKLGSAEAVREELIPWAEMALGLEGSDSKWAYALVNLVWAYEYVGEPEKAVAEGLRWLEQVGDREVGPHQMIGAAKVKLAGMCADLGEVKQAAEIYQAVIDAVPPYTGAAETAYEQLAKLAAAHPDDVKPPHR